MSEEVNDQELRKYLLGELPEAEQQAVEERLMTETGLFNLIPVVEDELIDDYLGGLLSSGERGKFESFFVSTPERRRKLSFAMTLRRYITAEGAAEARAAAEAIAAEPATADPAAQPPRRISGRASSVIGHRSSLWNRAFASPYLRMAAAAVIVFGLGLGIWRAFIYQSDVEKGMAALARAYTDERPTEARISGFIYAPYPKTRGREDGRFDVVSRQVAELTLLRVVDERPGPSAHHALGRVYLAKKDYKEAIEQFEKALKDQPNNAQIHSDYGAALLEKGKSSKDDDSVKTEDFAQSLSHLNRALAIDPGLSESLFDRALLHEEMKLNERAEEDWRAYLEKDSHSHWAEEAREHLDRLSERRRRTRQDRVNLLPEFLIACRARDADQVWRLFAPNREKLATELVGIYTNRGTARRAENICREAIDALSYAGELDAGRAGDLYTTNLAGFYRSATEQQLVAASQGQELMRRARSLYDAPKLEEGAAAYDSARQVFKQIGDGCSSQLATFWLGLCYWELTQTARSRELWSALAAECVADGHSWLQARTLNMLSGVAFKRDEYSRAIDYSTDARKLAFKINDAAGVFSADSALIEYYRLLGNRAECMGQVCRGLTMLDNGAIGPMALWRYYDIVATAHNTFGEYDAAIGYEREALRFAVDSKDFVQVAVSHSNLGLMCVKSQDFEAGFRYARQAYEIAAEHASEAAGQLQMALATLTMGHLHRERREFDKALASYDQAVELHRIYNLDFSVYLYEAYKGRLTCLLALEETERAREQLALLLDLLDKHRTTIIEEDNRNDFFAAEQNVYDLAIDLAHSQMHDWRQAFAYSETSRARSLLDSMDAGAKVVHRDGKVNLVMRPGAMPMPIAEVQARIPAEARLVYYALLRDKLLIWVISRVDIPQPVEVTVSQASLLDEVTQFRSAIEGTSDAALKAAAELGHKLYGRLIAPIESLLGGSRVLYIVPDKVLNRLPWDGLISPDDRFIVQDYLVTISPSATLFAKCTDLAGNKKNSPYDAVLSIGDPEFDYHAFPKLDRLPDSADEARRVADLYWPRSLLLGPAAREQTVRDELQSATVAHFALHCIVNERSPMRSSLVLAQEPAAGTRPPGQDGLLQAYEVYEMNLPRTRLVVLSACQTGVERYYCGEGMMGMATAFLVAHVPLVVSSLWPVDSKATAKLMILFQEYRKRDGLPTSEALRRAKCDILTGPVERYHQPAYWAGFEVIGGYARF